MLNSKVVVVFLVAVAYSTVSGYVVEDRYEEKISYRKNPWCAPSKFEERISCAAAARDPIAIQGGLYGSWEFHYVPMASAYYVARMADALGYQDCCPTNRTFLRELNIVTPWSGIHGAIAIDSSCGMDRDILRRCVFPTEDYPFLCTGSAGTPGSYGERLETLSYNSILQGSNFKWTLFTHCWRAKTLSNPRSKEIGTSWNVFNLEPTLSAEDRQLIIDELNRRGFDTSDESIIEFDYTETQCTCNKGRGCGCGH